ncbi:MAG: hypothetical protein MJY52_01960 [Bacteroidaceae bacterium]|nr:hypothetical protein [Bacteroidaceae bacterium]
MKRAFLFCCVMSCMMMSCVKNTQQLEDIKSGDLLFVSVPADYELLDSTKQVGIDSTKEMNYIHAAILDVDERGEIWISDATLRHGVAHRPTDEFLKDYTLKDGSLPRFEVMRLKDNSKIDKYMNNVKKYIGEQYDTDFLMNNGKHYCTELIYDAYADEEGHVFDLKTVDFRDAHGNIPMLWIQLFQKINIPLPDGMPGIMPQQMYDEGKLRKVNVKFP